VTTPARDVDRHRVGRLGGEAGFVGKFIVVWLLLLALLAVAAIDTVSIMFTRFRLDDVAATAANTAVATYRNNGRDVQTACAAAQASVLAADPSAEMTKTTWCRIDTTSGDATITLHKTANTLLAGRLSFTRDLTKVVERETAEPSSL
jgi:Tfp pilus assembly protein PilX